MKIFQREKKRNKSTNYFELLGICIGLATVSEQLTSMYKLTIHFISGQSNVREKCTNEKLRHKMKRKRNIKHPSISTSACDSCTYSNELLIGKFSFKVRSLFRRFLTENSSLNSVYCENW